MYYAGIAAVALVVNLILNWDYFKALFGQTDDQDDRRLVKVRYGQFLFSATLFFLTEIVWGLLYEELDRSGLFVFVYSVTVFYFIFMNLTMLTWARYIVAYIDKSGLRSIFCTGDTLSYSQSIFPFYFFF